MRSSTLFGIERDDLLKFADGLVERVAAGRRGRNGVLRFAQLAQIEAAQQTMRVNVVGCSLEQAARGASASRT